MENDIQLVIKDETEFYIMVESADDTIPLISLIRYCKKIIKDKPILLLNNNIGMIITANTDENVLFELWKEKFCRLHYTSFAKFSYPTIGEFIIMSFLLMIAWFCASFITWAAVAVTGYSIGFFFSMLIGAAFVDVYCTHLIRKIQNNTDIILNMEANMYER